MKYGCPGKVFPPLILLPALALCNLVINDSLFGVGLDGPGGDLIQLSSLPLPLFSPF